MNCCPGPASGQSVTTNAHLKTTWPTEVYISATTADLNLTTTTFGNIVLDPASGISVNTNAQMKGQAAWLWDQRGHESHDHGRNIALDLVAGTDVTTTAAFKTSSGSIQATSGGSGYSGLTRAGRATGSFSTSRGYEQFQGPAQGLLNEEELIAQLQYNTFTWGDKSYL